MHQEYLTDLQSKVSTRLERLRRKGRDGFHYDVLKFWHFLRSDPILLGILEEIEATADEGMDEAAEALFRPERGGHYFPTEARHLAFCYYLLRRCCSKAAKEDVEAIVGGKYGEHGRDASVRQFVSVILDPLCEYIYEKITDKRLLLSILKRYKHKCEWFQREHLFSLWDMNQTVGESRLALHLYEYLHDQGIPFSFSIEPASASGRVDLIGAQGTKDPLVADAKVFNPSKSKGKPYVVSAFNQIYTYTLDYNEPIGYLVIFKTCEADLKLALTGTTQSTAYAVHNNKTIFFVVIDIAPHEQTASKRGQLRSIEITETDLVKSISDQRA